MRLSPSSATRCWSRRAAPRRRVRAGEATRSWLPTRFPEHHDTARCQKGALPSGWTCSRADLGGSVHFMSADLSDGIRQVLPSARADLERLVRIPSVSADPAAARHVRASATQVATLLREAGLPEV